MDATATIDIVLQLPTLADTISCYDDLVARNSANHDNAFTIVKDEQTNQITISASNYALVV